VILLLYGPDPKTDYDRQYEESPPTDTPPALVPPLLRHAVRPEASEFTATLFDLVRRGYCDAEAVSAEASRDGSRAGASVDLELRHGDRTLQLEDFEVPAARTLDDALATGPIRFSQLDSHLQRADVVRFTNFSDDVKQAIDARGWYTFTAARVLLIASGVFFTLGMAGSGLLYPISRSATFYYGATMIDGAAVLFHSSWITKLIRRRRRTPVGQLEAQRWEAFRRYLDDFPRLHDAPAASLALWETYLVYAIAFGLARRVLGGAELYRLEELSGSPIFWLGLEDGRPAGERDPYAQLGRRVPRARARDRLAGFGAGR
jgi:uncharacterized membrane protein